MRELWKIVKDQIEERSVVVIVISRNSAICRNASLKSVMKENQLKYIDAEGMRVITNSKYVAEQIQIERQQKLKDIVMDRVKFGKVGKLGTLQNL